MFQTVFSSIIGSSKQAFVRPLLLPAAGLAWLAAGSSIGLTEKNNLRNIASCWSYSANILAIHAHVNVKLTVIINTGKADSIEM